MQKCQRCTSPATVHITTITSPGAYEETHLCEVCYPKFLHEEAKAKSGAATKESVPDDDETLYNQQTCPSCGIKFTDFRNTGRLGCPNDYALFRTELRDLLENIHGETRHVGKTPRRYPHVKQQELELTQLRHKLKVAVTREDYEEAAKLRDQIRVVEEA